MMDCGKRLLLYLEVLLEEGIETRLWCSAGFIFATTVVYYLYQAFIYYVDYTQLYISTTNDVAETNYLVNKNFTVCIQTA